MKEDVYNKDYQSRDSDRFSEFEPQNTKKKPSFLTVLLIGLCVLLVCSLCYDNIVKPYIESRKQQAVQPISTSQQDYEEMESIDNEEIVTSEEDANPVDIVEEPIHNEYSISSEQVESKESASPAQSIVESTANATESAPTIQTEQRRKEASRTQSVSEDESRLSTSEILEKRTHANIVKQAQRAGVSTDGTTSEILDRITRKQLENMNW